MSSIIMIQCEFCENKAVYVETREAEFETEKGSMRPCLYAVCENCKSESSRTRVRINQLLNHPE